METYEHAWHASGANRALLKRLGDRQADQAEASTIHTGQKETIRVEITRLLAADFIKEVYHMEWLANLVLVRKKIKNGEYALITPISTNTTLKTPLAYLAFVSL